MAHRHSHHHGGILKLDSLAAHSPLRHIHPGVKALVSIGALLLCVLASDVWVGIAVAVSMVLIMRIGGRLPWHEIRTLLTIPLLFLSVSCLVVLIEISADQQGLWSVALGRHFLSITRESLGHSARLFFQAMGAVCCLFFLSSTTPMPQLIHVLRSCRVPEIIIELMYLIYRYLFVLLEVQQQLTVSASARLGYAGVRRSVSTAGRICGALLASSFRRSGQCFDAMESRGYDGKLSFLSRNPPVQRRHVFLAVVYLAALLCLIFARKGWPAL